MHISMRMAVLKIVVGALCKKLFLTIPGVLHTLAAAGFNIIVDSLITTSAELDNFRSKLHVFDSKYIYLHAPEEVIIQREEIRQDRLIGSAINWLKAFDFQDKCDVSFDTEKLNPDEIAKQILKIASVNRCLKAMN